MDIEKKIFQKYSPVFEKLTDYGFIKKNNLYKKEIFFLDNSFKAVITVSNKGEISSKVYDIENEDEYLPLRIKGSQGEFVGSVRSEYENLLNKIRKNCFVENNFITSQSNRISEMIGKTYGDKPEFLWDKYPCSGIFRNPKSKKWYCAILDVDKSSLEKQKKGLTQVINLKLPPEDVIEIIKKPYFYEAYHMNKKHWISILLEDKVSDDIIMELVSVSHKFSEK